MNGSCSHECLHSTLAGWVGAASDLLSPLVDAIQKHILAGRKLHADDEAVLERDGYRCRVCNASGRDDPSIIVHRRVPGQSVLRLMTSLRPGCHAKVHRTIAVLTEMPPLLLELWREQHPRGDEQTILAPVVPARLASSSKLSMEESCQTFARPSSGSAVNESYALSGTN
jgi:hypothetical protein